MGYNQRHFDWFKDIWIKEKIFIEWNYLWNVNDMILDEFDSFIDTVSLKDIQLKFVIDKSNIFDRVLKSIFWVGSFATICFDCC